MSFRTGILKYIHIDADTRACLILFYMGSDCWFCLLTGSRICILSSASGAMELWQDAFGCNRNHLHVQYNTFGILRKQPDEEDQTTLYRPPTGALDSLSAAAIVPSLSNRINSRIAFVTDNSVSPSTKIYSLGFSPGAGPLPVP